jgi:hypothetical protein
MQHDETTAAVAAKLAPPVTVLGAHIAGFTVADWIQWLTLIYLILLVAHKIWRIACEVGEWLKSKKWI